MSEYLIQGETLTAIADAIRTKDTSLGQMSAADMAQAISSIMTSANLPSRIKEISAGSFTPTAKTQRVTVDLGWGPHVYEMSGTVSGRTGGVFVRWASGGNEKTDYYALLCSYCNLFWSSMGGVSSSRDVSTGSAVKNGTDYGGSNFKIMMSAGTAYSTQYDLYLLAGIDFYFQPGATYEWFAWRFED